MHLYTIFYTTSIRYLTQYATNSITYHILYYTLLYNRDESSMSRSPG